jgi:hypothetical protein
MGWTSGDFTGHLTPKAAIAFAMGEEFAARILDAVLDDDVVYAAVQTGDRDVRGLVLTVWQQGSRLHVKPISEDMGPADDRCPSRILDLLTETSNEVARDWRKRCLASHNAASTDSSSSSRQAISEDDEVRPRRAA